jgi:hypothetical protein
MTISGDPAHGGSYNLASAGPDELTVNVGFDVSRAFVGFLHDIAPGAQSFGDAGKPCLFGGRTNARMSSVVGPTDGDPSRAQDAADFLALLAGAEG